MCSIFNGRGPLHQGCNDIAGSSCLCREQASVAGDLPGGSRCYLGAQRPFQPPTLADVLGFLLQPVLCFLAVVNLVEVATFKPAPRAWCLVALETLMPWM